MATYSFHAPKALHKERFDKVVHALLQKEIPRGISKSLARKLVMAGACYLNGSRCRIASKPVFEGVEVRVVYKPERVESVRFDAKPLTKENILYHENGILVVDKPAHVPTVPTVDNARDNLVSMLKAYFGKEQYIGIHHRLDAQTSGCILFTTDETRNSFVSSLFQEHLIQKKYRALVHVAREKIPPAWEVKNQLVRAEKKKNRYHSTEFLKLPDTEGSFAFSRFTLLEKRETTALIQAEPVTGRTHQLRVHLAEFGLPVVGDKFYGGPPAERLMLHAESLSFREENAGSEIVITTTKLPF